MTTRRKIIILIGMVIGLAIPLIYVGPHANAGWEDARIQEQEERELRRVHEAIVRANRSARRMGP